MPPTDLTRLRLSITGTVQGVGFRPTIYRLALAHHLTGFIRNDSLGVTLEIQGPPSQIRLFTESLPPQLPPLAKIASITREPLAPLPNETTFEIRQSATLPSTASTADVTPDSALCPDCLSEFSDPANRRHRYALINCTNCGPRFSIIRGVPYDRANTTMSAFPLCPACREEFENPADRRFHAQPTCCPVCGPHLWLQVAKDSPPLNADPFLAAAQLLLDGRTLALKGLGGFHLACRADSSAAVSQLRSRKHRESKPLALMVQNLAAAHTLVHLSSSAALELASPGAPILLAPRRTSIDKHIAPQVAPDTHLLGILLPYTPVHVGLFAALRQLAGPAAPLALIMTSGNTTDEPIAFDNTDALTRLAPLADAFLLHNRPIQRSVDDSIFLDTPTRPLPIRRSRGYAPVPLPLPVASPGLALGGELKNVIAVTRQNSAILSQHLGDLTNSLAFTHFQQTITDMLTLFHITPQWIAHDLHPAYLSTQHAKTLAQKRALPLIPIQHHHAHAAAVLAEHNALHEPALALICDGTGLGPDSTIWGGELLHLTENSTRFTRLAHLPLIRLPGGDAAARDTRRPALALLFRLLGNAFDSHPAALRLIPSDADRSLLAAMIRTGTNSPLTSSTGRYFDAFAALLQICPLNSHEAQAPMKLEMLAHKFASENPAAPLETLPLDSLLTQLLHEPGCRTPEEWSWHFHSALAHHFATLIENAVQQTGIRTLALSGGVFCNRLFTSLLHHHLQPLPIRILEHALVPPTDAGLAFGQAAIASQLAQNVA